MDADHSQALQAQVQQAFAQRRPVRITGSGSKSFLGAQVEGEILSVAAHRGILHYEPSELVITARAGTPLAELEATLAVQGQMLAFEPPHFGAGGTLGGAVASGLSGPRRPYAGSARDFVLGCKIINGRGELLRFGGEVMKNVAGFDVSRLLTGSFGSLGVLLEVSLKVLPLPEAECTLQFEYDESQAIAQMNAWAGQPLPLSAACFESGRLFLRLSGSAAALPAAQASLGGELLADDATWWAQWRDQRHPFFSDPAPLWRLCVPAASPPLGLPGPTALDWGGAQRWLKSDQAAAAIRERVAALGGHATQFRHGEPGSGIFHPLPAPLAAISRRLKAAFDPKGILNPGHPYSEW